MIAVSNEFKKAIKEPERRIKGYVEVLYDTPNITITPTADYSSTYTNIAETVDGRRVENDYASLDYLPLDGTRLSVLDTINTNAGYISDDLFEDISNPTIDFAFEETTINGMTIYFKDNYPTNMTLDFSDLSSITVEPDNEIVQVIFDEPKTLTNVSITINEMEYSDRKIKIQEIDLGISYVYQDQDLIEFTVDEEVNKLVEEVPTNETNVTLNNIYDLFNPLNPQGVVKYLSDGSKIIPYIGVLTETQGVEFVKMGEFYFDSYTNNSDKTTTLVGKNLLKKLENELWRDDNGALPTSSVYFQNNMTKTKFINFLKNYNIKINFLDFNYEYSLRTFKKPELMHLLKSTAFFENDILYIDRNNKFNMKLINNNIIENLTKNELLNDVEYKTIDKINTIEFNKTNQQLVTDNVQISNVFQETFKLSKTQQDFIFTNDSGGLNVLNNLYSNIDSVTDVFACDFIIILRIIGNIGDNVTVTGTGNTRYNYSTTRKIKTNRKENEKEVKIVFDSEITDNDTIFLNNNKILNYTPSYEMSFEYNGDPSLEAGDYIEVETPYGYKPVFIQKNTFRFNGGLSGSIEGVE